MIQEGRNHIRDLQGYPGALKAIQKCLTTRLPEDELEALDSLHVCVSQIYKLHQYTQRVRDSIPALLHSLLHSACQQVYTGQTPYSATATYPKNFTSSSHTRGDVYTTLVQNVFERRPATIRILVSLFALANDFDALRAETSTLSNDCSFYRRILPKYRGHPATSHLTMQDEDVLEMQPFIQNYAPMAAAIQQGFKKAVTSKGYDLTALAYAYDQLYGTSLYSQIISSNAATTSPSSSAHPGGPVPPPRPTRPAPPIPARTPATMVHGATKTPQSQSHLESPEQKQSEHASSPLTNSTVKQPPPISDLQTSPVSLSSPESTHNLASAQESTHSSLPAATTHTATPASNQPEYEGERYSSKVGSVSCSKSQGGCGFLVEEFLAILANSCHEYMRVIILGGKPLTPAGSTNKGGLVTTPTSITVPTLDTATKSEATRLASMTMSYAAACYDAVVESSQTMSVYSSNSMVRTEDIAGVLKGLQGDLRGLFNFMAFHTPTKSKFDPEYMDLE